MVFSAIFQQYVGMAIHEKPEQTTVTNDQNPLFLLTGQPYQTLVSSLSSFFLGLSCLSPSLVCVRKRRKIPIRTENIIELGTIPSSAVQEPPVYLAEVVETDSSRVTPVCER